MGTILLIVNPVAGKRRARTMLLDIVEVFGNAGYDVTVRLTQRRGHACEFARSARREQFDRIVCVGGDGTLNEVISGLLESREDIPLGYVPLGSTNDFANSIGLPKDVTEAAKAALEGDPYQLDVGDFGGKRKFSYIASFGVFTAASYSAPQSTKNTLGHFAYILEGLKDILNIKSYRMKVEADGKTYEDDYIFGAVANSTSIGGIVKLDKSLVDMSDGLFEIFLMKKIRNPAELNQVVFSILNSNFDNKMFDFFHASEVRFTADQCMSWSLDGEEATADPEITLTNLHHAVNLIK